MLVNVFNGSWNGGYLVDGGRNLFKCSSMINESLICDAVGRTNSVTLSSYESAGYHIVTPSTGNNNNGACFRFDDYSILGIHAGDTITFSLDVKGMSDSNTPFLRIHMNSTGDGNWWTGTAQSKSCYFIPSSEFTRVSMTWTIPENADTFAKKIIWFAIHGNYESNLYIRNLKLEKGNVATDWTPAPEDIFEEGTKHPKSIFTNTIPVKKKYQYTYGFLNQNSLPAHTIRFMKPDGTWVKAVHVNEDATSGMKSLEIDDDYNIEIMFQNGLTDAQKASFKIMEENFMAIKASNQVSVIDITDGYSVILTNDSYTFLGDTDSVSTTQSTTSQIVAMRGSEIVSCTMGEVTCPNGLSVVSDNKTPSPTLTITATSALTKAGTIDIPIKIGDITIVKKFSFAIAFTGAKGDKGDKGTGVTIKSKAIEYLSGSSGTTAPTGTWQSTIPTVPQGQYLWTRTTVTYSDGNQTVSYSAARQGVNGTSPTVSSSKVQYQQSTSGTTVPTGTWVDTPPAAVAGQYMWSKTTATYSDGKTAVSYNVTRNGSNGAKGDKGDKGAAGADALALVITSSAGVIFKNTSIATTLTAHVYKGGIEMTGSALTALGTIKWYKDGGTTAIATGQTYTISAGDVENKANFTAQLEG